MRRRILVVDDEENIRNLYKADLEDEGFEVEVASSGVEALEKVESGAFDLVTLDIKMPDMDGIDLLRRIKERFRELPVILCTAYHHYKQDFGTWAADAYVVKSSDTGELINTVKRILKEEA